MIKNVYCSSRIVPAILALF